MANNKFKLSVAALLSICCFAANAQDVVTSVVKEGKPNFSVRYRYENVDEGRLDDTYAHTIQTRLGWKTGEYMGVSGKINFNNVTSLGGQKYNSGGGTSPDEVNHALIADPHGTVVDEAYLNFSGLSDTNLSVGRQHLNLDNERFFSDYSFRQTPQTVDAAVLSNTSFQDLTLLYAYVNRANTIYGEEAAYPNAHHDLNSHLFHAQYDVLKALTLVGYYYNINNADTNAASTKTLGAAAYGDYSLNPTWDLLYRAEYAHQKDAHNNPSNGSDHYTHFMLGLRFADMLTAKVGREDLESGFVTPYANAHKFNGWADMFTALPANGLEDLYVGLQADVDLMGPATFEAAYHDFDATTGSVDFGREFDVSVSKEFCKNWSVSLAYADYHGGGGYADTEKFWLTGTFKL